MSPPKPRLEPELVAKIDYAEQRKQNISVDKSSGVEGAQSRPALNERKEYVGENAKISIPRICE